MNNYIPANKEDKLALEEDNPLYIELFDRRAKEECSSCDNIGRINLCSSCAHNYDADVVISKFGSIKNISKFRNSKLLKDRPKVIKKLLSLGSCPLCDTPKHNWSGELVAYLSDTKGNLVLGNMSAKFCPICGKSLQK